MFRRNLESTVQMGSNTRRMNALEQTLASCAYVAGDQFTVADAYLFTVLNWTGFHKIDLAQWPHIQRSVDWWRLFLPVTTNILQLGYRRIK